MSACQREGSLFLADEAATIRLAVGLAKLACAGDVIALSGDLGSGKTTFARGFIRAITGPATEVPSPTFTLLQTYAPPRSDLPWIHHFDLFRLDAAEEAFELGIEEAFADGVSLIEWPERLGELLPGRRLLLSFAFALDGRRVTLDPGGDWRPRLKRAGLV